MLSLEFRSLMIINVYSNRFNIFLRRPDRGKCSNNPELIDDENRERFDGRNRPVSFARECGIHRQWRGKSRLTAESLDFKVAPVLGRIAIISRSGSSRWWANWLRGEVDESRWIALMNVCAVFQEPLDAADLPSLEWPKWSGVMPVWSKQVKVTGFDWLAGARNPFRAIKSPEEAARDINDGLRTELKVDRSAVVCWGIDLTRADRTDRPVETWPDTKFEGSVSSPRKLSRIRCLISSMDSAGCCPKRKLSFVKAALSGHVVTGQDTRVMKRLSRGVQVWNCALEALRAINNNDAPLDCFRKGSQDFGTVVWSISGTKSFRTIPRIGSWRNARTVASVIPGKRRKVTTLGSSVRWARKAANSVGFKTSIQSDFDVHTDPGEWFQIRRIEGVKVHGLLLGRPISTEKSIVKAERHLGNDVMTGNRQGSQQIITSIVTQFTEGNLWPGNDDWFTQIFQQERQGTGRVGHGVSPVQEQGNASNLW